MTEGRRQEELLKVIRTEDGKTEDITEEYRAFRRKQWEKYRARQRTSGEGEAAAPGKSRRSVRFDDYTALLPFSPERRTEFSFVIRDGTAPDGKPVYLVDVKAKIEDTINWDGTYTIDAETYTPVHARLRPSDLPAFVKELEVEAEFGVFEDVYYIPLRTWARVNAGFLFIKRYRVVSEEVYSDIRIVH